MRGGRRRGAERDRAGAGNPGERPRQIEEAFARMKTIGPMRKVRLRGREKIDWTFPFTAAAYNLVRPRSSAFAP